MKILSAIFLLGAVTAISGAAVDAHDAEEVILTLRKGNSAHTNHWVVIVDASRFWFNYRHSANALSIYRTVKRLGVPDSNIILMLADDAACNSKNNKPGNVHNDPNNPIDLYGDNIEVDYRGYEVTVENFLRVLTGRHEKGTPRSKRLGSDEGSNILVYMTGHGGDEFLKFQDAEEISSVDIADAFQQMWVKRRYNEIMFVIDTCQAGTMHRRFYSPQLLSVGSSRGGQNSYAYSSDYVTGVSVIDRFTYSALAVLERVELNSSRNVEELRRSFDPVFVMSDPDWRTDLFPRPLNQVLITDFFGSALHVQIGVRPHLPEGAVASDRSKSSDEGEKNAMLEAIRRVSAMSSSEAKMDEAQPAGISLSGAARFEWSSAVVVPIVAGVSVLLTVAQLSRSARRSTLSHF